MKLLEFEGKNLFKKYDIPIANGVVVNSTSKDMIAGILQKVAGRELVVKAQVLSGKRGKAGGIKIVPRDGLSEACRTLLGSQLNGERIDRLLIEEKLDIQEEHYLSIMIDSFNKEYVLLYSKSGGMNVEDAGKDTAKRINFFDLRINDIRQLISEKELQSIAFNLWKLFKSENCTLAEINPLVHTKSRRYIAADSKVIIDDNAIKLRAPEIVDLNYVKLEGDIGIIGNGAGLVMATVDALSHFGGKPACFLDVGGGANPDIIQKSIKKALSNAKLKALFINVFAGITKCDDIASGIMNIQTKVPIIVRMNGTNEQTGRQILEKAGINVVDSMEAGIKKAIEAKNGNTHKQEY